MTLNKKTMNRKNRKNKKTKSKRGGKSLRLKQRGGEKLTTPSLVGMVVLLIAAIGGTIWSASNESIPEEPKPLWLDMGKEYSI